MKKILGFISALVLAFALITSNALAAENLIKNGSFKTKPEASNDWQQWFWEKGAEVTEFKWEEGKGHTGKGYVTIINNSGNDARYLQKVSVKENTSYKASAWVKTENVGKDGKGACISFLMRSESSPELKGTNGRWEKIEVYFKTGKDTKEIQLTLSLGGHAGMNTGKASFDDVVLEEVGTIPAGANVINFDPQEPAAADNNQASGGGASTAPKSGALTWVIIIAAVVIVAGALYLVFVNRGSSNRAGDEEGNEEEPVEGELEIVSQTMGVIGDEEEVAPESEDEKKQESEDLI